MILSLVLMGGAVIAGAHDGMQEDFGFWQIYVLAMAEGLFDRFFIDTYWVGHTRAWTIPGTEDLKPYIPRKTLIVKWAVVIVGNPLIAAVIAGIMFPIFGR